MYEAMKINKHPLKQQRMSDVRCSVAVNLLTTESCGKSIHRTHFPPTQYH